MFVLPGTAQLLVYNAIQVLLLILISSGASGIIAAIPSFVASVLSTAVISASLAFSDKATIASFRRASAVVLAGGVAWTICSTSGFAFAWFSGMGAAVQNSVFFGVFLCWGLEFLIINGAFTKSTGIALVVAAIHPITTFSILRTASVQAQPDVYPVIFGIAAFIIIGSFIFLLRRKRTSMGLDALGLFQAFMKTWVGGTSTELEGMINKHTQSAELTSKVMRFESEGTTIFIVLPAVHPGPFHSVGSYNLPGAIVKEFSGIGHALTLHRPGGHERNLATVTDTVEYARQLREFASRLPTSSDLAKLRGPFRTEDGTATITGLAFSDDALLTVTFAPRGADDLDAQVEEKVEQLARESGLKASVVDAHNSIGHERLSPEVAGPEWKALARRLASERGGPFRVAYAHSGETDFKRGADVTENGMSMMMIETGGTKEVLILADANNAVPTLRGETEAALKSEGYGLIELCTSDSHDLAARGLTVARGYHALGESTPTQSIASTIVKMAKLAEPRLAACKYGSGTLVSNLQVFGSAALDEFAKITQSSSRLGRAYLKFAAVSVMVLLLSSILS